MNSEDTLVYSFKYFAAKSWCILIEATQVPCMVWPVESLVMPGRASGQNCFSASEKKANIIAGCTSEFKLEERTLQIVMSFTHLLTDTEVTLVHMQRHLSSLCAQCKIQSIY